MANANGTLLRAQSKPEKIAQWLFNTSSNWRNVLAFVLIAALTYISMRLNIELGILSAVDDTSRELLPTGYALLDLCGLFLSGYLGIKSRSIILKCIAFIWFTYLLALSLWAAASFTISIDSRVDNADIVYQIEQKKETIENLTVQVGVWTKNLQGTQNYKTAYQVKLDQIKAEKLAAESELQNLEKTNTPPTQAIYQKVAPFTPFSPETLNLIIRLCWAAALTLSPLVLALLIAAELHNSKMTTARPLQETARPKLRDKLKQSLQRRKARKFITRTAAKSTQKMTSKPAVELIQKVAQKTNDRSFQSENDLAPAPIKGHNQHTETLNLNALRFVQLWLVKQKEGRVTRAKITAASRLHNRESVTKIIQALLNSGELVQYENGHFYKPALNKKIMP